MERLKEARERLGLEGEKKKKPKGRQTGLKFVHEVKTILKATGKEVEGPKFKIVWIPDKEGTIRRRRPTVKPIQVHEDFFGIWDLISWDKGAGYNFYQVTTLPHWTDRKKLIEQAGLRGEIWGRFLLGGKIAYKQFSVGDGEAIEWDVYMLKDYQPKKEAKEK